MMERVHTGIAGFDELVQGGLEKNSVAILAGVPGTGKTTFALQFLYTGATQANEPGVFLTFNERRDSIIEHYLNFGWDFAQLEKENKFRVISLKPQQVSSLLQSGGGRVRDEVEEIKAKRIVLDSVTAYALLFKDEYLKRESITEFFNLFREWGLTALVIAESNPKSFEQREGSIGSLADTILHFYYLFDKPTESRIHCMEVYKMRGSHHENHLFELAFEKDGVAIRALSHSLMPSQMKGVNQP